MAYTFDFSSNTDALGRRIGSSSRAGQLISSGNLFSNASQNNNGFYVNGVNLSNIARSLSNMNLSGSNSSSQNQSSQVSDNDWSSRVSNIASAVGGLASIGYDIFNSERNYQNQVNQYADQMAYLYRQLYNQENAIVNQAQQYAKIGLNPLYMSGNGMSYSTGSFPDAPQKSNLNTMATIQFMDNLATTQAQRNYIQAQTKNIQTKTAAQQFTNLYTLLRSANTWSNLSVDQQEILKLAAETDLVYQMYGIRAYDMDITQNPWKGQRYKDSVTNVQKNVQAVSSFVQKLWNLGRSSGFSLPSSSSSFSDWLKFGRSARRYLTDSMIK